MRQTVAKSELTSLSSALKTNTSPVADSSSLKIPLESTRARLSFFVGIILIAGSLTFVAGKVWLAAHWDASWDPDRLLRAANLEPTDADYWYRLGLYEKWTFEHRDLRRAVVYYQRATEANPRSDTYWMDLADAYEAVGQTARAREAFERAQSAHPISSDVAWRYGNFLLRRKDYPEAFAEMRRALLTDPKLTIEAVSECAKASNDVPRILSEVLPNQNGYYLVALDYFLTQHQTDAALTVWNRLLDLKQTVKMAQIVPLINELIDQERVEDALGVWQQALGVTSWPQNEGGNSSLVFNGGFENDLLNGAFDWREDTISGAAFSYDSDVVHAGGRALRITFDGSSNLDFQNLWQFSPVEPRHRYHFAAYLRLEGISTDSGIRFVIHDAFRPAALQILSPDLVGSHPWSLVEADLVTGPETHLLIIALRRVPSWKFDNKLRGTVWVDDVSLVPVAGGPKEIPR
jgi:tetratricopeptide (TPR) repeat protein